MIALDAEHPCADLVIAANLATGDPAAEIYAALRETSGPVSPIFVCPLPAAIAADVASGPGEQRAPSSEPWCRWAPMRVAYPPPWRVQRPGTESCD
jgi:hypothetical protein